MQLSRLHGVLGHSRMASDTLVWNVLLVSRYQPLFIDTKLAHESHLRSG